MLRRKLFAAFMAMALLTALSGAVALNFVARIGDAVTVFSDITQPLARRSLRLSSNAEKMEKAVMKAVLDGGALGVAGRDLVTLDNGGRAIIDEMRTLAARGGLQVDFPGLSQNQAAFVDTLGLILKSARQERTAVAVNSNRQAEFQQERLRTYDTLKAILRRADGLASEREETAKVEQQLGSATVDSLGKSLAVLLADIFPVQRYSSQLLAELGALEYLSRQAPKLNDDELVDARKEVERRFAHVGRTLDKLGNRLHGVGADSVFQQVKASFASLNVTLQRLFTSQHELLEARTKIDAGKYRLDEIDRSYATILGQIAMQTERLNQNARQQAKLGIENARNVVSAATLLAFIAAMYFGFLIARRIAAPLVRLAGHAAAIRESGKLVPLPDAGINERPDEIGGLARSFNALVVELAEARRRLIEWSEAEIKAQFERLNAAVNNMPIGLTMFDDQKKLIICNDRYAEIYHLNKALTKPGTPLRDILTHVSENERYAEGNDETVEQRLAVLASGKSWRRINELSDGRIIAISHNPLPDGGSIATHEDITERRKAEQQIAYMAHHDALTDLPNRVSFRDAIVEALDKARGDTPVAIHCLDLDHFKAVNDTLGHPIGDVLLKAVAARLLACVREQDMVARLGGDEFAVVQVDKDQPVAATALATRLVEELSEPYEVEGHQVVIGASIGITVAPGDGTDPDQLMKKADMALYRAKQNGRGAYSFFAPGMDAEMQARRLLELDLRKAIVLHEFELFYQPTVSVASGKITGFEALLRWRHPERGLVSPLDFIPLTEEIGLINQIGSWVLKQACRDAKNWPDDMSVAVNVSPVQFKSGTLVLDVIAALGASGLPARRLEIEITEAVLLNDTETTVATLNELRSLGVRIAMDDFGTGYSSLGYLQKFPFDKIKIDRAFIHDLPDKADSRAIVRAVAGLGSALGIVTTAEGVETKAEYDQLKREGCTEVQGYLFSEPRPAGELAGFIRGFKKNNASAA